MKKFLIISFFVSTTALSQYPSIIMREYWSVSGYGMAFNVEAFDINKDGNKDIFVGNWNDTYVYFGGKGILDSIPNLIYKGRLLAICDYNGDGYMDLITMHLTNYDSTPGRSDYDGEILFYYGSNSTTLAIDTVPSYSIPLPTKYPTRDEFSLGSLKSGVGWGDFNGDGKADIVIQSHDALPDGVGVVYVYMGNSIPPDTATYVIRGRSYGTNEPPISFYGDYFQIGDINNDGYSDLLVSYEIFKNAPFAQGQYDSLDVLDIYLGGKNFAFVENGQSFRYESRMRDENYSYGWVNRVFSLADINGDGIPDLTVSHIAEDSTDHVHFGSAAGIDTIPSFYLRDPDTTRSDVIVGALCTDIGDINNDGYDDFILTPAGYNAFTLNLGGPHLSNNNPYGLRGLLEAYAQFPNKAIGCGDQNGDGVNDFVVTANAYGPQNMGYVLMFLGDRTVKTAVNGKVVGTPTSFELNQNFPNPFNPSTVISFQLARNGFVALKVYDLLGKTVATLIEKEMFAGKHEVEFNPEAYKLGSGAYFYELKTENQKITRKMLYMK